MTTQVDICNHWLSGLPLFFFISTESCFVLWAFPLIWREKTGESWRGLLCVLGPETVYRRTDRQTDRQTGRQTDRQTDRQTGRQTDRHTGRQADRHTGRQAGGGIDRQTERQVDRQTEIDRQTHRPKDLEADQLRQTESVFTCFVACLEAHAPIKPTGTEGNCITVL